MHRRHDDGLYAKAFVNRLKRHDQSGGGAVRFRYDGAVPPSSPMLLVYEADVICIYLRYQYWYIAVHSMGAGCTYHGYTCFRKILFYLASHFGGQGRKGNVNVADSLRIDRTYLQLRYLLGHTFYVDGSHRITVSRSYRSI